MFQNPSDPLALALRWLGRPRLVQALLFALAALAYANSVPNKWAVDDSLVVYGNRFVQRGLGGVDSLLTCDAFYGFYGRNIRSVTGGRWRPLSPVLFAAEAELLAPLKKNARQEVEKDRAGFRLRDLSADTWFPNLLHLQNVLLFGLLCAVLYRVLLQLLRPERRSPSADAATDDDNGDLRPHVVAATAAALFAVHPLHTEVVANVKSCDEILALLGGLLALHCALRAAASGPDRRRWLAGAAGTFGLALLAKETAAPFAVLVPLALWFFRAVPGRQLVAVTAPLLLVLGLYAGLRTAVVGTPQVRAGGQELMNNPFLVLDAQAAYLPLVPGSAVLKLAHPTADTFRPMPYAHELATNVYTYGRYLKLLVWPWPLTTDYYPRHIAVQTWGSPGVWWGLLLNAGLLGLAVAGTRRRHPLAFAIWWYFATFGLVSNLLFPVGTNMAERFLFGPSVGFCLAVGLGVAALLARWPAARWAVGGGLGLAGAALLLLTWQRNPQWHDNYTLFTHDAQVSVGSGKVKTDLAGEIIKRTQRDEEQAALVQRDLPVQQRQAAEQLHQQRRDSALLTTVPLLREALAVHPMSWSAWLQLGTAYWALAQTPTHLPQQNYTYLLTALAALDQARFYQQGSFGAGIDVVRSQTYRDLGRLLGEQYGDVPHAIEYLEKSKALDPDEPQLYYLLGSAYSTQHDYPRALANTQRSLALRPGNRETQENLAVIYQKYATADPSQRPLLPQAERLLQQVQAANRALPDNDPRKLPNMRRTLGLLSINYALQGNAARQAATDQELAALAAPPVLAAPAPAPQ